MCLLKQYCQYYEDGNCPGNHETYDAICKSLGMKSVVEELLKETGCANAPILVGTEEHSSFVH